jgi:phosphate transport system protein
MTKHLERDLAHLETRILSMGGLVEQALDRASAALVRRDEAEISGRSDTEREIDRLHIEIDDECLKILALSQPVAVDLRFVTVTMKIANDLERIGDLAGNLAERARFLLGRPVLDEPLQFEDMADWTRRMLHDSLDALTKADAQLAIDVCGRDDHIDEVHRMHFDVLQPRMKRDPGSVESAVALLSASRNFERIADLATNIAEDVVFLVQARDIRHSSSNPAQGQGG